MFSHNDHRVAIMLYSSRSLHCTLNLCNGDIGVIIWYTVHTKKGCGPDLNYGYPVLICTWSTYKQTLYCISTSIKEKLTIVLRAAPFHVRTLKIVKKHYSSINKL